MRLSIINHHIIFPTIIDHSKPSPYLFLSCFKIKYAFKSTIPRSFQTMMPSILNRLFQAIHHIYFLVVLRLNLYLTSTAHHDVSPLVLALTHHRPGPLRMAREAGLCAEEQLEEEQPTEDEEIDDLGH